MIAAVLLAALLVPAHAADERVLRVCDDVAEPASLNPYQVFSEKTHTILQQILEGLVRFDPQGKIEPALATSWERRDPTTMRFHLRRGVLFHNGEPFDAKAAKFSLERYVAPDTKFVGYDFVKTIASVEILDDFTIDVKTHGPDGPLLNRLAAWVHIVPPAYLRSVGDGGFSQAPIGTGPFVFNKWEKGKRIELSANGKYWMPGFPAVGGLVFEFIPLEDQVDALLGNGVDIITNLPGTRTFEVQKNTGTYVIKQPTFYTIAANFNTSRPPLSNKRVRQALNLALDRNALIRYDLFGNGSTIGTLSMAGEFGHNGDVPPYPHDQKRARQILAQEGYSNGFTLKVLLKRNAERTGRILAAQWKEIGVNLDITLFADADIWTYFKDHTPWDMSIWDCPDPMHHSFFVLFAYLAGSSPFALHPVAEIDERLARVVGAVDQDKQLQISKELDAFIHDEFLAVPTYQRVRTYGLRRGVAFTPHVSGMSYFFRASFNEKK